MIASPESIMESDIAMLRIACVGSLSISSTKVVFSSFSLGGDFTHLELPSAQRAGKGNLLFQQSSFDIF